MDSDFLRIDELRLDEECINQPALYFEWAQKHADAKRDLDEARIEHDLARAELSAEVRKDPSEYGIDKVTESAINTVLDSHKSLEVYRNAITHAKHKADVLGSAVSALDQRKRMLVLLVEMKGQELYSAPRVSSDGKQAVERETKKNVRSLGRRLDKQEDEGDE